MILPGVSEGLALALNLELSAVMVLLAYPRSGPALLMAIGLHAAASLLLAFLIRQTLPANWRRVRWHAMSLLFAINLFIPGMAIGLRVSIWLAKVYAKMLGEMPIHEVREPEYIVSERRAATSVRGGKVRAKLTDPDVPGAMRLSALLSIQEVPGRFTSDLIRDLLADPLDDVRLLAYGMMDGKEKAISHRIFAEKTALEKHTQSDERYASLRKLAELNHELIFQKLVQGDVRTFCAQQSKDYAEQALQIAPTDAGLWYLVGRVNLVSNDVEAAQTAFDRARDCGFPIERITPYAAECAWRRRDLDRVRELFASLEVTPGDLQLAAVYRYWRGESL
jgi:polysaccharide biosynthesis protein PelE